MRRNLEEIDAGGRARLVTIGYLSGEQLEMLNLVRAEHDLPQIESGEILFIGRHVHKSRIQGDGYTINDVLIQIESALNGDECRSATAIQSSSFREDGYGNKVKDRAVFECTSRRPRLELFSVIPSGDKIKPTEAKEKDRAEAVPKA
jgi:hypothetical protein